MKKFMVGASTAAHQVEGNNIYSDYWKMEHLKHSSFAEPSGDAVDHYNHYEEDIRILRTAGLNAYRFGIEWARIEPQEGKYDMEQVEHYRKVLTCCHDNGITPIVTLMHFSSPAWLIGKGGWGKPYVINVFARYCGFIAKELGQLMPYIATINEANMGFQLKKVSEDMMRNSSKEGDVQVGVELDMKKILLSMLEEGKAFHCSPFAVNTFLKPRSLKQEAYVMQAHQAAKAEIKKYAPNAKVGLTVSLFDYQPQPGGEEKAAQLWQEDFGFYLPYIKDDDFLGVQNYSRKLISAKGPVEPEGEVKRTQMGYEYYPWAIGNVLRKVAAEFPGELVVTENGIATADDSQRCDYVREATASVIAAARAGVPVTGYMHWSLLDNFEWQAGFEKTFGLIAVDRTTQKRYPKESLAVLGNFAKGVSNE